MKEKIKKFVQIIGLTAALGNAAPDVTAAAAETNQDLAKQRTQATENTARQGSREESNLSVKVEGNMKKGNYRVDMKTDSTTPEGQDALKFVQQIRERMQKNLSNKQPTQLK